MEQKIFKPKNESEKLIEENIRLISIEVEKKLKEKVLFHKAIADSINNFNENNNLKLDSQRKKIYYGEVVKLLHTWTDAGRFEKKLYRGDDPEDIGRIF